MITRTAVWVRACADEQGRVTPEMLRLRGQTLKIDRVVDCRPARQTRQGGSGIRYTVLIGQTPLRLCWDDRRWYVEEESHVREVPYFHGG